jgi:hypothetical protein
LPADLLSLIIQDRGGNFAQGNISLMQNSPDHLSGDAVIVKIVQHFLEVA